MYLIITAILVGCINQKMSISDFGNPDKNLPFGPTNLLSSMVNEKIIEDTLMSSKIIVKFQIFTIFCVNK